MVILRPPEIGIALLVVAQHRRDGFIDQRYRLIGNVGWHQ